MRSIFEKEEGAGDVSPFATLCTTLAADIGTGSIVGVATALRIGGPGAMFWMWVSALLGCGTFPQVNAITESVHDSFHIPVIVIGVIVTILTAVVTLGGIQAISKVAQFVVPFMAIFFIGGSMIILIVNHAAIPGAFARINKKDN